MASEADALQEEEAVALAAIYGELVTVYADERRIQVRVPSPHGTDQELRLGVLLPSDYPAASPPIAELSGRHVPDDVLAWAVRQLEGLFVPGDVAVYNMVEWVKEADELWTPPPPLPAGPRGAASADDDEYGDGDADDDDEVEAPKDTAAASRSQQQRKGGVVAGASSDQDVMALLRSLGVVSGQPHTEKKSTFQAHAAAVTSFDQVAAIMDALLLHNKVRAATHNIMAYRIVSPTGAVHQDYDDDGETAAGGRLLHLLQVADVRNVVVVVSRWFGGVLMGPGRFTAINNTARELLEQLGHMPKKGQGAEHREGRKGGK